MSLPLAAQGDLAAIQQQLQERITLATLDSNGEIVTAGSVITLQKSSLQMCGTGSPANAGAPANTYKNGKLSAGMFSWTLGLGLAHVDLNSIPMHTFAAGDKFWVVRINVKKNGVEFKLWTDPDANNLRYWGWLEVPFPKNQIPSPDEVMNTVAEVLSVDNQGVQQAAVPGPAVAPGPTQDTGSGISGKYLDRGNKRDFLMLGQLETFVLYQTGKAYTGTYSVAGDTITLTGPQLRGQPKLRIAGNTLSYEDGTVYERQGATAPPAPSMPEIAPPPPQPRYEDITPPPPPPADAPTISIGQTKAQVIAAFGEPQRKASVGAKEIFFYTDLKMKVTFTNEKISSID